MATAQDGLSKIRRDCEWLWIDGGEGGTKNNMGHLSKLWLFSAPWAHRRLEKEREATGREGTGCRAL